MIQQVSQARKSFSRQDPAVVSAAFPRVLHLLLFSFDNGTRLDGCRIEDIRARRFVQSTRSHRLKQVVLTASLTFQLGEQSSWFSQ